MIKINVGWFIGTFIAGLMAYKMWGITGLWFIIGLSLQTAGLYFTIGRK